MLSPLRRLAGRARSAILRRRLRCFPSVRAWFRGRRGLEIGGPSDVFMNGGPLPVYGDAASVDNCNFSPTTVWGGAAEGAPFVFDPTRRPGRQFIAEATDLRMIPDGAYEFLLASHALEHVANPLRALLEWKRVVAAGGAVVVVVPDRERTFDHRRPVTAFAHLLDDYERRRGEDDLTHLDEILALHDLSRDPAAGTFEQFKGRSERNVENRCLHHHVFDQALAREAIAWAGFEVVALETAPPHHIVVIGHRPQATRS